MSQSESEVKNQAEAEAESAATEADADQDDSALDAKDESPKEEDADAVTKEQLQQLAEALKSDWNKLATELNFPDDEVTFIANETDDVVEQALKMLTVWQVGHCRVSMYSPTALIRTSNNWISALTGLQIQASMS